MIIVLKPNTSKENVARVEELIKRKGLDTHVVNGAEMTVIGCIGDTTRVDPMFRSLTNWRTAHSTRKTPWLMYPVSKSEAETWHLSQAPAP